MKREEKRGSCRREASKKERKRKRQKQKQKEKEKEKQRKETTQVWDFMKRAEQKKESLRKLHKKELVETVSTLKKFVRQFTVEGEPGFDPKAFFNVTKLSLRKQAKNNGVDSQVFDDKN